MLQYYTIIDFNEVDIRIYLPIYLSLLRVDKSLCLPKLKSITVLLYDFSFKNENFATFTCSIFYLRYLRTFSQVLATFIKIL